MEPLFQLIAVSGPQSGNRFGLKDKPLVAGRESTSDIHLADVSVSRRHCVFELNGEQVVLNDLQSMNGTFVNGVPITQRTLASGDRIQIGGSIFLFFTESEPMAPAVDFDDSKPESTVQFQQKAAGASSMAQQHLAILLQISMAIHQTPMLEDLQRQLLELISDAIPVEFAAILDSNDPDSEPEVAATFQRDPGSLRKVSRTVCAEVLRSGAAIISNDVQQSYGEAASVADTKLTSVLCAPIYRNGGISGLIYLASADPRIQFEQTHLELLAATGRIVGPVLENARRMQDLKKDKEELEAEMRLTHGMIGESIALREVLRIIEKAAPADSTVLITGESGTGKEMAARAIHDNSARRNEPFVAINCATLSDTLFESELFGHEKGAFTGAVSQKKGKLELADKGTLFLDEVSELPLNVQAKLLRVLQEREFERVGGLRTIHTNVRIIAATNKDLQQEVNNRAFRSDLFYRLNVVQFRMPSLRERKEDIPLLAAYFLSRYTARINRRVAGIAPETRAYLLHYDWPGNVRELQNAMERAVVLGSDERIFPEDLPENILEREPPPDYKPARFHDALRELKRKLIVEAVKASGGNYTEAAKNLGLHPNYLHRLIRNLDLKKTLTQL